MPGFWGLTLLLGYQASLWQQTSQKRANHNSSRAVTRWLTGSGIVVVCLLLVGLLHVTGGILQKPGQYSLGGGFWPAKDDTSTEIVDIRQLRQGFSESPVLQAALQESSFVFTNTYLLGGQIGMALAPLSKTPVTCFDQDLRGFAFWSRPDQWLGQDALYITSEYFAGDLPAVARYGTYFDSIQPIGEVPIRRGGVVTQVFQVYQAKRLLQPYPRPYGM
ncbi:MAG: hypothetical protein VKJ46_12000 [Leptolyngbyaceae bacterium]|nr:hypothetical protein [Leptolyngbyaceae bacterium]